MSTFFDVQKTDQFTFEELSGLRVSENTRRFEAYLALQGRTPNPETDAGKIWLDLISTYLFEVIERKAKTPEERVLAVGFLSEVFGTFSKYKSKPLTNEGEAKWSAARSLLRHPSVKEIREEGFEEDLVDSLMVLANIGGKFGGDIDEDNPLQFFDLIKDRINLALLPKMLGFAHRCLQGAKRLDKAQMGSLSGYGRGGLSQKTHPLEMYALSKSRPEALQNLSENALLTRQYQDRVEKGGGDLVLMLDESGSTQDIIHNLKAFELSLAESLNRVGRKMTTIAWGSGRARRVYRYGKPGFYNHLMSYLSSGSTVIAPHMGTAYKEAGALRNPDILIITDGNLTDLELTNKDLDDLKRFHKQGRVWVIIIGYVNQGELEDYWGWCDGYVVTPDITKEDGLDKLLTELFRDKDCIKSKL